MLALIAMEAKSDPGREALLSRKPLPSLAACDRAQSELAEMVRFFMTDGLLPLAGLIDIAPLFARETVLDLEESWLVVRAVRATQSIRETFLRTDTFQHLASIAVRIPDLGELLTKTNKYFTREGKLREEASAELRAIRQKVHAKRAAIQRVLNDVMNRHADAIQEPLIVMRGDRYCIPVRSDNRNAVTGILHERSGSGASFFIEPMQAVELNNDLADLLIQEREEIARITRYVSQLLAESFDDIADGIDVAGEFDALQACAIFHQTVRASRPRFADRELDLIEGRHPLLDERLAEARLEAFGEEPGNRTVVPISVHLDGEGAALVISGPNAGGKTIALKTAGLLVAMGMCGLPVPASEGTILPFVDALHVLIGDDQSVLEHLSTFSAYLTRLKRVVTSATPGSLVLLDELGSGTDPEEGAALAAAVLEHMLTIGSLMIVTTHLSALKSFAVGDTRIVNASMEFDSATGQPTYRMISGIPGRSRAIEVAQNIGLPSSIIAAARERLGDQYGETDNLLAQLQARMSDVLKQREEVTRLQIEMDRERRAMQEKTAELEKERAKVGSKYREELDRLRDDVTRQLAAELKNLREMDRNARGNVNANEIMRTLTKPVDRAMEFVAVPQRDVRVGDKAEHRQFKVRGDVASIDGKKAMLNVNGRKMQVELSDLTPIGAPASAPPPQAKSRYAPQITAKASASAAPVQNSEEVPVISAELYLVGRRVDEALEESDKFLDRSIMEGKAAVRIIHGFGTGTLRKAVREYLRRHKGVKSWRPGDEHEGGDGATVAVLG